MSERLRLIHQTLNSKQRNILAVLARVKPGTWGKGKRTIFPATQCRQLVALGLIESCEFEEHGLCHRLTDHGRQVFAAKPITILVSTRHDDMIEEIREAFKDAGQGWTRRR